MYKAVEFASRADCGHQDPLHSALSAERERRLVQEPKAASSPSPNIVTIYDIDTQQVDTKPLQYIAMENVGGETLDQLIGKKGLRIRDVLKRTLDRGEGSRTQSTVLRARALSFIG